MSIQLILYPQSFNGLNSLTGFGTEQLVDGVNFNGIDNSSSYDSTQTNALLQALTNAPPTVPNAWYRFRSTHAGTPALPSETSGVLTLRSSTTSTLSGVYQRLSNLNVGQTYTITINNDTVASGLVIVNAYNGTSVVTQQIFSPSSTPITANFVSNSIFNTIAVTYSNTVVENLDINNISVQQATQTPLGQINNLGNGQVICDLYENEDIPLTLSIDNFKNVAEKVQSYSKAFNLPATKRNNKIFDNIFDVTRTDDGVVFNPYVKTKCELKQDGFILFDGYLRLIDISDKDGEMSYNVNLYSESVALADVLKERSFRDLDFSELEHAYNKTNIKYSWNDSVTGITYVNANTSGFRTAYDTIKYPFVDWNHQILVADGFTGNTATLNMPELTGLEQAFRPFIQIKYLIQRIFQTTPFTYTSEFLDNDADFQKLYMDFNWGSAEVPTLVAETVTIATFFSVTADNFATTSFSNLVLTTSADSFFGNNIYLSNFPPNYDQATNVITATTTNEQYIIDYKYVIENTDSSTRTAELQWVYNNTPINNTGTVTIAAGDEYIWNGNITVLMQTGDTLQAQFKADVTTQVKQKTQVLSWGTTFDTQVIFSASTTNIVNGTLMNTLRGELQQWDFLKGIMTMFNLVAIPNKDNPNNITIEPYADVFINNTNSGNINDLTLASRSIAHDWTEKIDVSQMKLTPLTELNKITNFKFVEDDEDYCFRIYKNATSGHLYGSKVFDASNFTILSGEEDIEATPFASTIVKPLMPPYAELVTPAIYSYNADDGTTSGFDNSPRIMYNNGKKTMTDTTYYIPDQNGLSSENQPEFLQFSHLSEVPTIADSRDFHFGECQYYNGVGQTSTDNLFNTYWLPYFNELYNPDTRTMTLKVNLNAADISTFNMYDTVFIKNRRFRVNKIEYKPNDLATVEFILIP